MKNRCSWVNLNNPRYVQYHDEEWGIPQHDDRALFELLILEGFQAGLSWECVLNKREAFRKAYFEFDAVKVSTFSEADRARLLANPDIIRNRLKILASISNTRVYLKILLEFETFRAYFESFLPEKIICEP